MAAVRRALPTDTPPVPKGFDWDLWLGPEAERPYHPNYTHMVFRGWYDFGGGSMADMGHYSLWTVFNALELGAHPCRADAQSPLRVPGRRLDTHARTISRSRPPVRSGSSFRPAVPRPAVDLFWYDGGMRPPTPEELDEDRKELPAEGMMFVGDKGKILAGFHVENPRLIPEKRMTRLACGRDAGAPQPTRSRKASPGMRQWIAACRGGQQSPGSFLNAWPISESRQLVRGGAADRPEAAVRRRNA